MPELKKGMFAVSKAGHDKGRLYVIIEVDDSYVYLADGRLRPLDKLKKKKKKHVQLIRDWFETDGADDALIRRELKGLARENVTTLQQQ